MNNLEQVIAKKIEIEFKSLKRHANNRIRSYAEVWIKTIILQPS